MLVSCRVGLCCVGLSGWVAWLRRVGSCCSRWPPGSRGTNNLQVPGTQGRRSGTYYLVHGMQAMHGKKCGEGIRIEAPDSNFGRLVGWQWVGAGFTGFNSSSTVDQVGHPSPRRWYTGGPQSPRARETESQTDMQRPSDRLHVLDPLSLLQSQHPVSSSGPSAACCLWRNCKEPTYPLSWPPCPCPAQPCKHSGTLHLTSFPRVCVCVCLPIRPWFASTVP